MISLHDIMIINVLIAKGMYLEVWNLKYYYFLYFSSLVQFSHVLHAHKYLTNVWCLNTRGNSFGKYIQASNIACCLTQILYHTINPL